MPGTEIVTPLVVEPADPRVPGEWSVSYHDSQFEAYDTKQAAINNAKSQMRDEGLTGVVVFTSDRIYDRFIPNDSFWSSIGRAKLTKRS